MQVRMVHGSACVDFGGTRFTCLLLDPGSRARGNQVFSLCVHFFRGAALRGVPASSPRALVPDIVDKVLI